MSMLPPFSRGGKVRSPSAASGGQARSGVGGCSDPPAAPSAASRDRARSNSSCEGRDADDSGEDAGGDRHTGQFLGPGVGAVELPAGEEGTLEEVAQEARAGPDAGPAEVLGLVGEDLHLEHVARLRAAHLQRAGERVGERGRAQQILVAGAAAELAVAGVAQLEGHLIARVDGGHGGDVGVPAVVAVRRALVDRARAVDLDACAQSP